MPTLTDRFYKETAFPKTNIYIETGAYLGNGIKSVLAHYKQIHSIELAEKWYNHNVEQFKAEPTVKMHLGDSKKVLPGLLTTLQEPVTIFLDAHYSGGTTAFGDESNPLLYELDLLLARPYDDIIIIDDCRMLGVKGVFGAGPSDPIYPDTQYDWSDITENEIMRRMKPHYMLLKNTYGIYTNGPADQYILVKQPSSVNFQM